ncbi:MAG TPA: AMIN domain-containing protein, partial [Steroidobacteraceae bacterium]|nr:AMIN domain-containing protein [Steroidobacteraceae bacterium]
MAGNDRATASNKGGRYSLRALGGLLATLAVAWGGFAQAQGPATTLTSVEVQSLAGDALQVTLNTSGPAPAPLTFTIDQPARLSVDLADVGLALENRRIDVNAGGVDSIVAAEAGGRTRVVFNLDSLVAYTARAEGDAVIVTLGGSAGSQAAEAEQAPAMAAATSAPRQITGIDFRRSAEGAGRVIVKLSDVRTPASLKQEGNRVIVDFTGAQLPEALMKRYDVLDFATPVSTVDATRSGSGARIVVTASGDFEQLAYQTDDTYVVEVKERPKKALVTEAEKVYIGERLTLNFQDIEVRAVLQLLADTSGQNIVVSDTVKGRVTLRLQNVPWDQAM